MEQESSTVFHQSSSSAAAPKNIYSAKELGEMINNHSAEFPNVDIGLNTDWYANDDYMEEMLSYIKDETQMNDIVSYILLYQDKQTHIDHHPKVCCRVTDDRKYAPFVSDLSEKLSAMCVRVLHKREIEAKLNKMKSLWSVPISTDVPVKAEVNITTPSETKESLAPVFTNSSDEDSYDGTAPLYHLNNLPEDVRNQILIDDDNIYSSFVVTLTSDVKDWIDKNNLYDWNVVRFICRLRGIVAKKCSMAIFGKFLDKIGLGNQENNMKQYQDANDPNALFAYDNPPKFTDTYWKLRKKGKEVENLLADFINSKAA